MSLQHVEVAAEHVQVLERWCQAPTTQQRLVRRSRIILMAANGHTLGDIADELGTSRSTVRLWVERYGTGGPDALSHDRPGRGRKPLLRTDVIDQMRQFKAESEAAGHRVGIRELARRFGVSPTTVHRALVKAKNGHSN
jgi:transposase